MIYSTFLYLWLEDFIGPVQSTGIIQSCFRYDDNYHLHFTYIDGQTKEARSASMVKSVSNFYDINGSLCMDIFEPEIRRLHTDLTSERKDKWLFPYMPCLYVVCLILYLFVALLVLMSIFDVLHFLIPVYLVQYMVQI